MKLEQLLESVMALAVEAGAVITSIYDSGDFEKLEKSDQTPVTTADLAANDVIVTGLSQLPVDYPILSEESDHIPYEQRANWQRYWLVDPLDGTGEFIKRSGDFAVNIALIENGKPIMGVIHAPVTGISYAAISGQCVFRRDPNGVDTAIQARSLQNGVGTLRFAISRRQKLDLITELLPAGMNAEFIPFGSSTLKSCMVAEGSADCYLRIGPTGEWDTGAAECIVRQAGGSVMTMDLQPLTYNQRESFENPNFMVVADPGYRWGDIIRA
ncbi:3'(2'),5'-bisphosphate nucleotidase CysQ [Neiella marina]|uniref:3'(2'),5'-bisphosphate nucleotidase CysQ n=1 Tax=Neiella holothuriorum TaxID=2870530 RepID=A0ABS7EG04_9GAMM|nr:3'(2'),5'-bisphosphate nucleotidase CysQ [Neiella holothuriorum]MBW8191269.1 3'(2'),5'-bisphosphate nucleotidase CysQ [Neiella holothuriorum]